MTPTERAKLRGWERLPGGTWCSVRAGHGRRILLWPVATGGWRTEHDVARHETEALALAAALDHADRETTVTIILRRAAWEAAAYRVVEPTRKAATNVKDPTELCCVAAQLVTVELYGAEVVARAPTPLWRLWPEAGDPWGPVSAVIAVGVGSTEPGGYLEVGPRPPVATDAQDLARATPPPGEGVWRVQIWRDRLWGSGHTTTWTTDGLGGGWQWDSVEGRAYDARARSWAELVREAAAGLRAVRLLAPERTP